MTVSMTMIFDQSMQELNPSQKEAVKALGRVLISAGAGTGKTRVLTLHYAYLVKELQVPVSQIMAVTFTNKACQEMRHRLESVLTMTSRNLWIGTFHGLALRILKQSPTLAGRTSNFSIIDTRDQLRVVGKILKERHAKKMYTPQNTLEKISAWKQENLWPEDIKTGYDPFVMAVYIDYQDHLRVMNAVDFDDLLLLSYRMLGQDEDLLRSYQKQFSHVLVDEYQDINSIQYWWMKRLSEKAEGLFCVGDEDQSIYGWRGASVETMLRFEKDFPGATILRLEDNYRSTAHILSAASGLISNNQSRFGKILRPTLTSGKALTVQGVWDPQEEAAYIAQQIWVKHRQGRSFSDMAVLMRTSAQGREFEERFLVEQIPYHVVGSISFYERQEVRDFLGYLRLVHSSQDNLAFERIVNVPRRGLGTVALEKMHRYAKDQKQTLEEAAIFLCQNDRMPPALGVFLNQVKAWREHQGSLTSLAERIFKESGYEAFLQGQGIEGQSRLEHISELLKAVGAFQNLEEFLEHVGLLLELRTRPGQESVVLMTLHGAKGLEFKETFLPGWEENLFPHVRCIEEGKKGLEEERRLAYVALTRARENATITFCWNRRSYQGFVPSAPSRFLQEIPKENVVMVMTLDGERRRFSAAKTTTPTAAPFSQNRTPISTASSAASSASFATLIRFQKGQRVHHKIFGWGTVESQAADSVRLVFDQHGAKTVIARFLSLQ